MTALGAETQMGTISEGFALELCEERPASAHRGLRRGTPGCGKTHPLCLASLRRGNKGWKLAESRRRVLRRRKD